MPKLRPDSEIKEAFAKAAGLEWIDSDRAKAGSMCDAMRLREITVRRADSARFYQRLARDAGYPEPAVDGSADLLAAEVVEFCPVPLPNWQSRAFKVLQEHSNIWLEVFMNLTRKLSGVAVYSVPFAAFLLNDEPESWVSQVGSCEVSRNALLSDANAGGVETIYYFRRPYIVWPLKPTNLREYVTILPDGTELTLCVPDLRHSLLEGEREQPKKKAAAGAGSS